MNPDFVIVISMIEFSLLDIYTDISIVQRLAVICTTCCIITKFVAMIYKTLDEEENGLYNGGDGGRSSSRASFQFITWRNISISVKQLYTGQFYQS